MNSAVLGAAYQAKHGLVKNSDSNDSFQLVVSTVDPPKLACSPHKDADEVCKPNIFMFNTLYSVSFINFSLLL